MSDLIQEIYGKGIVKTPYQVLLQLDRYTVKELDLEKVKVGDVIIGVYDESNPKYPKKDFGRVTKIEGENVTFKGEVTGEELTVSISKISIPLDYKWDDTVDRMVKGNETIEKNYGQKDRKEFADRLRVSLREERIVPGGRIQASLGIKEKYNKDFHLTAYNCYVIPSPHDSRSGIIKTQGTMVEIMSRGGGVGTSISTLRPRNAIVYGVNGRSSGSVSWGGLLSYTTGLIEQGGSRKGALMLQLHVTHPDIFDFIRAKKEDGNIENANLSVQITKEFKEAVDNDDDWHLIFPDIRHPQYDKHWSTTYQDIHDWLNAGLPVRIYDTVKARKIMDEIVELAHASGDPGMVVYDNMNDGYMTSTQKLVPVGDGLYVLDEKERTLKEGVVPHNNTFYFQKNTATNPCGEQPLAPWSICNLVHINLSEFYDAKKDDVKWEELKQSIHDAVRFADNVIDYTHYFLPENEEAQKNQRRIGMGTLGLHDLLLEKKLRYGSDESLEFIDKLYEFIKNEAYRASALLAKERGKFPKFDLKILQARIPRSLKEEVKELIQKYGLRNSHLLTQAPTGTTGTKTGRKGYSVSTGIEPFIALEWTRHSRVGDTTDYLGKVKEYLEKTGEKELPSYFVSALGKNKDGSPQISPEEHVRVQATIQKHNDSAISKTVNVPKDFTVEETKKLYTYGLEQGLVGITIYRDKSKKNQVLSAKEDKEEPKKTNEATSYYKRPQRLPGETLEAPTPFGKMYATINSNPKTGLIEEVFLKLGRTGADISAIADGLAIALTAVLSPRISNLSQEEKMNWIIEKFKGIKGQSVVGFGKNKVESLPDALANVFIELKEGNSSLEAEAAEKDTKETKTETVSLNDSLDICPKCGQYTFVQQDGCSTCLIDLGGCGHSKC